MSNTVYWNASTDADAASYELELSDSPTGTWAALATVTHTIGGAAYSAGPPPQFFYVHAAGTVLSWYRVRVLDGAAQYSPYSAPFRVGFSGGLDPTTSLTSTALLASIKRRATLPVTQVTYTDADLLDMADEELSGTLVPLLMSASEDFFLAELDLPVSSTGTYRIPRRAIGSKLHSACALDADGEELELPRVSADSRASWGCYVRAGTLVVLNEHAVPLTGIRVRSYLRPSTLVDETQVAYVVSVDATAGALWLSQLPTVLTLGGRLDVLKGGSPFDTLLADTIGTISGSTVTFPAPVDGVEVGDIVTLAGQANVVQLPAEWFPVLAQAVAAKVLEEMGDTDGAVAAHVKLEQAKAVALGLVTNRVDNNVEVIVPAGPWRR